MGDNIIIYIGILIGAIIWCIVIKFALKDNEKIELERKREEEMLSVMTESERKKYKKDKSKDNLLSEIIYVVGTVVGEFILSIF